MPPMRSKITIPPPLSPLLLDWRRPAKISSSARRRRRRRFLGCEHATPAEITGHGHAEAAADDVEMIDVRRLDHAGARVSDSRDIFDLPLSRCARSPRDARRRCLLISNARSIPRHADYNYFIQAMHDTPLSPGASSSQEAGVRSELSPAGVRFQFRDAMSFEGWPPLIAQAFTTLADSTAPHMPPIATTGWPARF